MSKENASRPPEASRDATGKAPSSGLEKSAATQALNVLVVEDDDLNQKVISRFLKAAGHDCQIASSGGEALEILGRTSFDCVIMDIQMPGLNGMETTKTIREMEAAGRARTPIVALTAHAMKGDRERFLAAGMDAYLSKPVAYRTLIETISSVVSSGSPRPEKSDG